MLKKIVLISGLLLFHCWVIAQHTLQLKLVDRETGNPLSHVTITDPNKISFQSDTLGQATIQVKDSIQLSFTMVGYQTETQSFIAPFRRGFIIAMEKSASENEAIVVTSTRIGQNIETAPIKVEVLGAEEMEEESSVKPAGVMGIIGDISGVQIQQLNAISGNSNVRIQGLDGKYTQILRDGLPLYEGFSGGFGLMSIPPLDLKQVEMIKGSSSTLYGGGAIGGLVNLISKKPSTKQEAILSINQTTLKETNFNSFFSKRKNKLGYTLYAGTTYQSAVDVNKDGMSDVSRLNSLVLHPRLFIYPNTKTNIIVGYTVTKEERLGGDMLVIADRKDSIHQYFEKNKILRNSFELLMEHNFSAREKLQLKSSYSLFDRDLSKPGMLLNARQTDFYNELSYVYRHEKHSWVAGLNFNGLKFEKLSGDSIGIPDYSIPTQGAFVQYNHTFAKNSSFELGLRNDNQKKYGHFLLPRVAVFHQLNKHWGIRAGYGAGYKIPNPLSPQLIEYDIQSLVPFSEDIKAERSYGYNAEFNYKLKWDEENEFFINHAFFLTQLNDPLVANRLSSGNVIFFNGDKPIVTKGFDTYLKLKLSEWELYAGLTYTIAERKYLTENQFMPLTPKFRMAYMLTREWEGKARFCIESSYNGYQYRLNNTQTPGYLFLASMVEYKFNDHLGLVLNCENLLDYRQSKKETLFDGTITNPDFKPLWAPIDGRVVNACLKFRL